MKVQFAGRDARHVLIPAPHRPIYRTSDWSEIDSVVKETGNV